MSITEFFDLSRGEVRHLEISIFVNGTTHCTKFESNTNRMTFEYAPNMMIVKVYPLCISIYYELIWFLVDCKLTEWTKWSKCPSCGEPAQTNRTRNIKVKPENGGKACEKLDDTRDCNNPPCPGKQIHMSSRVFTSSLLGIMKF